jgi:glycosyltransferase involved in cell wall biosynthesis
VRISVAMATHDAEPFLRPLLESLAAQSRLPDELVVCDDASSDGGPQVAEEFAASAPFPVRVHRCERWRGHVAAFLDAARRCTGDAIAFCDADDVWRPDKLAVCGEALERTGAILALHTTAVVDAGLADQGRRWPAIRATELVPPLGLTGLDIDAPGMAMLFRRELLEVAPFDDRPPSRYGNGRLMLHDEWVFFLAGVLGPIQLIDEPLLLYRQHGSNDSGGWVERRRERTLRPATDDYRNAAEHTRACAAYLERAARANPGAAERLLAGARAFAETAESWELRERLYAAPDRRSRARVLRRLLAARAYRDRRTGGFGRVALGKDLAGVALRVGGRR